MARSTRGWTSEGPGPRSRRAGGANSPGIAVTGAHSTRAACRGRERRRLAVHAAERVAFVPRGAGTGLSGGTLPVEAPVMVGTSRLTAIEAIDVANRRIVVQAGVVNQWVTNAVRAHGLCYAPDPSSQPACTIGG